MVKKIKDFLKIDDMHTLLMYASENYSNGCGDGNTHFVENVFNETKFNSMLEDFEERIVQILSGTKYIIQDIYDKGSISFNLVSYEEDNQTKHKFLYDNDKSLRELEKNGQIEILDNTIYYLCVKEDGDKLNLEIIEDGTYQTISSYISIQKVLKDDVRYCVIVERPVNARQSGQFILAGPYRNLEEAREMVDYFCPEKDIYGEERKPYVIATYKDDKWLKYHYKKVQNCN